MDTVVDHSLVMDLTGRISGSVLTPSDAGYEAARAVKRRHDPDNVLHLNHNIAP